MSATAVNPVRILPHVRGDQLLRMVSETGHVLRHINGHACLVPEGTPLVPLFLRRRQPAYQPPEPPQAA